MKYIKDMRVRALKIITDGDAEPNFDIKMSVGNPGFVHAIPGDTGTVVYIDDDGCPTIVFDRKKTATVVGDHEIEVLLK